MAIQDDERAEIIAAINSQPESVRKLAAKAFLLGHEEGWWLARTDPESGVSPVEHAAEVNPFTKAVERPGYVIVTIAYNRPGRLPGASAKSIPVPLDGETVPVEFYVEGGSTVIGYTLDLWSKADKDEPLFHQEKTVPAVVFMHNGTYTVNVGELVVS
jgi:hypothetical protein